MSLPSQGLSQPRIPTVGLADGNTVAPAMDGETAHARLCRLLDAADQLADRLDRLASRALGRPLVHQRGAEAPTPIKAAPCGFPTAIDQLDTALTRIANHIDALDPLA